jgi:lysozyme
MPTPQMTVSENGLALTKSFEGFRDTAYQDQRGIWTIGFGHTLNVVPGMTCDKSQGTTWLAEDMASAEACVNVNVRVSLTQGAFDALCDLAFNIGNGNFKQSTLLRLLNGGDTAGAAEQFLVWDKVHVDGELVDDAGLERRRQAERALFLS